MTANADEAARLIAAGNDLEDRGLLDAAHEHYLRAIAAAPQAPRPWLNLGNVLERQGFAADAIAAVQSALAFAPEFAPAHFNLGRLYLASARRDEAEEAFREALRCDPALTDAKICLATSLDARGRAADAEAILRDAVATAPAHPGALHNLALTLMARELYDEAESLLQRALTQSPDFAAALGAMGNVHMRTGRVREAEGWHRRKLAAAPGSMDAASSLLFCLLARDDLSPEEVYAAHREIGAAIDRRAGPRAHLTPKRHDRLRIGYLSPDFRQHAVALFMHPVLAHHDRSRCEIFCYYNHGEDDAMTRQLRPLAEHWRDIAALDDAAAVDVIRRDEIDILIDLAGYTGESRLALFAHGSAPVQVTWLGYLHSTGMAATDYRISDADCDPPGQTEHLHSEALVRMPHSQWCYEPVHDAAPPPDAAVLREDAVFGAFNQFWKMSDRALDLWLDILHRLPQSELRFAGVPEGSTTQRLRARVAKRGIDPTRVSIAPRTDVRAYFASLARVDIGLDTMPYNGATTTLDGLWMGVPVVALAGDRSIARGGASILRTLGLPELVAATAVEYVEINVRLAQDRAWRAELRATLRDRMRRSPLMDGAGFTRDLEAHYAAMFRRITA